MCVDNELQIMVENSNLKYKSMVDDLGNQMAILVHDLGLSPVCDLIPLNGRVSLPEDSKKDWSLRKWGEQLNLSAIPTPLTEYKLEEWAAGNASRIRRVNPPSHILLALITDLLPPTLSARAKKMIGDTLPQTLFQVVSLLVDQLLPGSPPFSELESKLFTRMRENSASEGINKFYHELEIYAYMSIRHLRESAIRTPQLKSLLLASVPEEMIRELSWRKQLGSEPHELTSLFYEIEASQLSLMGVKPVLAAGPAQRPVTIEPIPHHVCGGCLENHSRSHCPYRNHVCYHCHNKGHLSHACNRIKVLDRNGQSAGVLQQKGRTLTLKARSEQTKREQYASAAKFLDKAAEGKRKKYVQLEEESDSELTSPPREPHLVEKEKDIYSHLRDHCTVSFFVFLRVVSLLFVYSCRFLKKIKLRVI